MEMSPYANHFRAAYAMKRASGRVGPPPLPALVKDTLVTSPDRRARISCPAVSAGHRPRRLAMWPIESCDGAGKIGAR